MRKLVFWIWCMFFAVVGQAKDEPVIRVRVIYTLDEIQLQFKAPWTLNQRIDITDTAYYTMKCAEGKLILKGSQQGTPLQDTLFQAVSAKSDGKLMIRDVPYGIGWWWAGIENRTYSGEIEFRINSEQKIDVIVCLPVEKYLYGVLPSEMGGEQPLEALKAQAVAARSETFVALYNGMYRGDYFDICADVDCQVFSGNSHRTARSDMAVDATRGMGLFANGRPINAFFASNCGGVSENVENVWPDRSGPVPYWSSHIDADTTSKIDLSTEENVRKWVDGNPHTWCNYHFNDSLPAWSQRNFRWTVETSADSLTAWVNREKNVGKLITLKALKRGPSGRIIRMAFIGEHDTLLTTSELSTRMIWKPPLKSSCFYFDTSENPDQGSKYILKGAGWGHGVGMCQSGAVGMAQHGKMFMEILNHYFPTAEIKKDYQ